jgi:hypothetical protein
LAHDKASSHLGSVVNKEMIGVNCLGENEAAFLAISEQNEKQSVRQIDQVLSSAHFYGPPLSSSTPLGT